MNIEEGTMQIFGTYMRSVWRDELTGCTYFFLSVPESVKERNAQGMIMCTGTIPEYQKFTPLAVTGIFEQNKKGVRFKCIRVQEKSIDEVATIEYLSSGICKGISTGLATKIVEITGPDIFQTLSKPNAVTTVMRASHFISKETATALVDVVFQTRLQRELFEYIAKFGGHWNSALRFFKSYGTTAKEELQKNPFIGMKFGLTFEQCDAIAMHNGLDAMSPERINAGAVWTLKRAVSSGNEYILLETLAQNTCKLLQKGGYKDGKIPEGMIASYIEENREMYIEKGLYNKVWLKSLKEAEENTAFQIKRLMRTALKLEYHDDLPDIMEKRGNIKYAPAQRDAFKLLQQSGVAILTGGPGTGKTTTVLGLINGYTEMYPEAIVKLCAPTGRAAQRMSESTKMEATTLHKLLDYRPYGDSVTCKNAEDPINADMVIVDESSMIDIEIASLFFSALKDGTLVLLIGDVDQLPSVGPGNVLHDMIFSEKIPVCRLSTVYRQSGDSPIIKNAYMINSGDAELDYCSLFERVFCKTEDTMMPEILKKIDELYDKQNPFKTQILVPTHKGAAGCTAINKTLQNYLNPKQQGDKELHFGQRTFRIKDKIIMMANNYEAGYFNGDIGIVTDISDASMKVQIMDKEIDISGDMLNDINLAYAMTIHKSQGSEFENVIVSLPCNPASMLKRNLLYTAVTRAKQCVYIVSENGAIAKAVASCDTGKRKTDLRYRLRVA